MAETPWAARGGWPGARWRSAGSCVTWQTTANGSWTSSGWSDLGNSNLGVPTVGQDQDGRLEVYATTGQSPSSQIQPAIATGVVWANWQITPGGAWNGWASHLGAGLGNPAVINNSDGRLEMFASDSSGVIWHKWQTTPNGSWSSWTPL